MLRESNGFAHHHAQEGRQFPEVSVENIEGIAPADAVHQGIDEDNPWAEQSCFVLLCGRAKPKRIVEP